VSYSERMGKGHLDLQEVVTKYNPYRGGAGRYVTKDEASEVDVGTRPAGSKAMVHRPRAQSALDGVPYRFT
jgi:hypothetical protein